MTTEERDAIIAAVKEQLKEEIKQEIISKMEISVSASRSYECSSPYIDVEVTLSYDGETVSTASDCASLD